MYLYYTYPLPFYLSGKYFTCFIFFVQGFVIYQPMLLDVLY